jgi:hypothetical protein
MMVLPAENGKVKHNFASHAALVQKGKEKMGQEETRKKNTHVRVEKKKEVNFDKRRKRQKKKRRTHLIVRDDLDFVVHENSNA